MTHDPRQNPRQNPPQNLQHGVPIGDGQRDSDERVATGDRREEVHYERRANGELRAQHLKRPDGPLPPHLASVDGAGDGRADATLDVAVAPDGPSVWDARPPDDDDVTEHPGRR